MEQKGETSLNGETTASICMEGIIVGLEVLHSENTGDATNMNIGTDGNSIVNEVAPSLLSEIISDILSRLPIEDIIRYKIVSKDWYALTKDPHFIDMHLRRALCLPRRLILEPMVHGPISSLHLIDREDGMWRGRKIPVENMQGDYMVTLCSCHGLLCIASSTSEVDPLVIYNPITRESMQLPKTILETKGCSVSIGFGFDPTNKKYKIVRFFKFYEDENPNAYMKSEIITLGEASWRVLEVSHTVVCSSHAKPVFLDDALHWIIDKDGHPGCHGILVLDMCNEKFRTIKFPSSLTRSVKFPYEVFLLNLGGSLSLVEHGYWEQFCVWRIARSNTKTGYKFYQSSHSMTITYKLIIWSIKLHDKLVDNSFLFHVRHISLRKQKGRKDQLVLYYSEQDDVQIVDVSGIPEFFQPSLFIPCLVSPCAALGNRD